MAGLLLGAFLPAKVVSWLAPVVEFAAVVAIGFGAGVAFEHRPHQGVPFNIIGQGLAVQRDEAKAATVFQHSRAVYWMGVYNQWHDAEGRCESARRGENDQAGHAVETQSTARSAGESSAFNSGYSAGRVAGALSCGAAHHAPADASHPTAGHDPIGDVAAGSVRQPPAGPGLNSGWAAGAYHAPDAVPAHR